jgi:hypothetical protein
MVRPLRPEDAVARYRVMARGNRRKPLYADDSELAWFLVTLVRLLAAQSKDDPTAEEA